MYGKGKAWASVVGAALVALYAVLSGDNHIDSDEWVQVSIAVTTAVSVYVVPLAPQYRWAKTAVAVILGVLQILTTVIVGGLETNEWIVLALAALTAGGVAVSPAVSDNGISSKNPQGAVK